ncbi:MAG: haloacid dehalogenase-like hydrolase [Oscillospiraceae bacterium]|nr:haloacid dehalogenase-like hydrolase [Oscillospiraceae bacterium]
MERDKEFDEVFRKKISEILDEAIDESVDADDLMFDLGLRFLRMKAAERKKTADKKANQLSLWVRDAASKKALVEYVESVTDKKSPDYIPHMDRIAVFDLDGTLFCESDPTWFDFMLYRHRILEDCSYADKATEYEKKIAGTVQSVIDTGEVPAGFEVEIGQCIAHAFAGMRVRDFARYVRDFAERPSPGYDGMNIGEAFYQPMVQVIDYLHDNGFTVYVCSGSDRLVVRGIVEGGLILAARHVIGTEELISAKNQGGKAGSEYVFSNNDELVLSGKIAAKNLKMTKVSMIAQQIGQCPVLSFGNSAGDISMTNFVLSNDRYKTAAFFVCCDDDCRENGSPEKAQKVYDFCAENGWIPISMKNDWLTVFGEGVTKKKP